MGLANNSVTTGAKVTLVAMLFLALILTAINVIAQKHLRCPIWVLLIGLYVAMNKYLMPLIIILAVTSVLDDLVFTPIIHYYYTQTVASKTIDKREAAEDASIVNNSSND